MRRASREVSIAKTLQRAGYATAVAGKWSQLAYLDTPEEGRAWGFDEFLRWDKSQGERYWKPALNKNGQVVPVTDTSYIHTRLPSVAQQQLPRAERFQHLPGQPFVRLVRDLG
jgi:arylsulfatase A-like enzyme